MLSQAAGRRARDDGSSAAALTRLRQSAALPCTGVAPQSELTPSCDSVMKRVAAVCALAFVVLPRRSRVKIGAPGMPPPVPGSSSSRIAAGRIASPDRTSTPWGRTDRTSTRFRCRAQSSIPMRPNGVPLRSKAGAQAARRARGSGIRAPVGTRRSARRSRPSSPCHNATPRRFLAGGGTVRRQDHGGRVGFSASVSRRFVLGQLQNPDGTSVRS
jgi:hypothetical protein